MPCARSDQAARSAASAFIGQTGRCPTTPSPPASVIIGSSLRSVPVGRSGCAGS